MTTSFENKGILIGLALQGLLGQVKIIGYAGRLINQENIIVIINLHLNIMISACDSTEYWMEHCGKIIAEFEQKFCNGVKFDIPADSFVVMDRCIGPGYGIPAQGEAEMIQKLAATEGVFLDPTYGGKAFLGLLNDLENAESALFHPGDSIVFINTGKLVLCSFVCFSLSMSYRGFRRNIWSSGS